MSRVILETESAVVIMRTGVLIADDHGLVAEGLVRILESEFNVVGTVSDGRTLVERAVAEAPDVVVLDISMPLLNGFDAARLITRDCPNTKLIFVTMHTDLDYVREAFRSGARGYVCKRAAASELVTAVRKVAQGEHFLSPFLGVVDLDELLTSGSTLGRELTQRQREVLQLIAEGRTAKEIAHILNISVKTVDFHKACIMQNLGLRSTAELTRYALDRGLVARSRN